MGFEAEVLKGEKYVLKGPGGPSDAVATTKVLASGIHGGKLFLVQQAANTAEVYVFDLGRFSDGKETAITPDEFYALREELHEVQKVQARQALGGVAPANGPGVPLLSRGPGRPPKAVV